MYIVVRYDNKFSTKILNVIKAGTDKTQLKNYINGFRRDTVWSGDRGEAVNCNPGNEAYYGIEFVGIIHEEE